jgi:hypothetical protein
MVMPPAADWIELFEPLMKEIFRRQRAAPEGEEEEPGIRFAGLWE